MKIVVATKNQGKLKFYCGYLYTLKTFLQEKNNNEKIALLINIIDRLIKNTDFNNVNTTIFDNINSKMLVNDLYVTNSDSSINKITLPSCFNS